ncbi:hypothetical protein V8C42DRAFT_362759 [Trichoderma barbatum]
MPSSGIVRYSQDDMSTRLRPSSYVDYFSHNWTEETIQKSWRYIASNSSELDNAARLGNASLRIWIKHMNKLKTIPPEALNWYKDYDVTWLYGPLQTNDGILTSNNKTISNEGNGNQLGINFLPKLRFAAQSRTADGLKGAEDVEIVNNTTVGSKGMVDFSPVCRLLPGSPQPFPPATADPGSVGDSFYRPLIQLTIAGGEVWNAPSIAGDVTEEYLNRFCDSIPESMQEEFYSKVHDQVIICPLFCLDASDPLPATIDGGTFAPRLKAIKTGDDDAVFSGIERFFVATNGYTNRDLPSGAPHNESHHPWRQGLSSAVLGEGNALNILGAIPTVAFDYAPLRNFNLYSGTNYSISSGIRTRLTGEFEVLGMAAAGYVTDPDCSPLSDAGFVTNCPPVYRFL